MRKNDKQKREASRKKRNRTGKVVPILTFGDLKQTVCRQATENDYHVAGDLLATMLAHPTCVGLAAPQIGHDVRIIVMRAPGYLPMAFINPVLTEVSVEKETKPEQCMSYPGLEANVDRHRAIWMTYGNGKSTAIRGFAARVIQHEMDHLDGFCQVSEVQKE